jgi:hypothetical protein
MMKDFTGNSRGIRVILLSLLCAGLLCAGLSPAAMAGAKVPTSVKATLVDHKTAYSPKPNRGDHIDIKITPPEIRGKEGRLLVEVYNRGKIHISSVTFDLKLKNNEGFEINAPVNAQDLKPNLSGGQWVKIPPIKGRFPKIISARALNIRVISVDAVEISLHPYLDLIKY